MGASRTSHALGASLALALLMAGCGESAAPAASEAAEAASAPAEPSEEAAHVPAEPAPEAAADTAPAEADDAPGSPKAERVDGAEPKAIIDEDDGVGTKAVADDGAGTRGDEAEAKQAIAAAAAASRPIRFTVGAGSKASFLIDAPLEKIKGRWSRFGGEVTVNPADIGATRGAVTMQLGDLKTHTFGEPDKDARQTGHALNWMEVGSDVSAEARARYGLAKFTIERVEGASPNQLAAGQLAVQARVVGTLELHGVRTKKTVPVTVTFEGSPEAPSAMSIRTHEPLRVSLKQHDIKPRDLAGKFLAGALDKIGQKIADTAQVTITLQAKAR